MPCSRQIWTRSGRGPVGAKCPESGLRRSGFFHKQLKIGEVKSYYFSLFLTGSLLGEAYMAHREEPDFLLALDTGRLNLNCVGVFSAGTNAGFGASQPANNKRTQAPLLAAQLSAPICVPTAPSYNKNYGCLTILMFA